ncbi:DNA repair ATPase [Thalassomonas actiniarum]|uniref:DNA repair ATPase n=1 Tax=Thalassomonas actiniarum TaxID=485447 RepID=A0AAE9YPY5_9GAMM|nr:DNA repair ATPase [Thalassomonas actiniarum]WDD99050.1 DNA repair ATPase [Thalassomonas actiniarum]
MSEMENVDNEAVAQGGSYELIQRRLQGLGEDLTGQLKQLNDDRISLFGSTDMKVEARVRVRTEHNCVARDIAAIGELLLFGYNVFLGLKRNITVADVFSLHKLVDNNGELEMVDVPFAGSFLDDADFIRDFDELYTYYKKTFLAHVYRQGSKVFAVFQIGERLDDIRVFQWGISADGEVRYIDNRGERNIKQPENFDFEWQKVSREQQETGKHPHYNLFDTLFVEAINGSLTLKVENNTEDGQGIYSEEVDDAHQSLDDAEIHYAKVGELILLKIKPYREQQTRHLIFNCKTQEVLRQDAIEHACVQLPEDHGIIFPGGYYLQSGENKSFDDSAEDLQLHRVVKSPNGEDFLYIFYEPNEGQYALFGYNLITRTLQNPIYGHGQSLANNGRAVVFNAESEPSRIHAMQIWQTPFCSEEYASEQPTESGLFGKIGNPELVRGISDLYGVVKLINVKTPSVHHFNDLVKESAQLLDKYHWLTDPQLSALSELIKQVINTSELVLDEFEKVASIKAASDQVMLEASQKQEEIIKRCEKASFDSAEGYVQGLTDLAAFKGELISHKDLKYIDLTQIETMEAELEALTLTLSQATADFLQKDQALKPYQDKIEQLEKDIASSESITALKPIRAAIDEQVQGLELLNHTMLSLNIEDSRQRTRILEDISTVFSQINRVKASADLAAKNVGSEEARAEFGARFKLLGQSVTSALNASDTPQACDQQLSTLLIQLEELESQFSDYDEFYQEILAKRDEIYDNFEQHKQQLMDAQQRRCLNLKTAADRILEGINRRSQDFNDVNKLNSYFAADPMMAKLRQLTEQLRDLDDNVRADDIDAQLKNAKEQGIRALRDKTDIYSADGSLVKIGEHQFSVNRQKLELTLLPREQAMVLHISGTDYFEPLAPEFFAGTEHLWQQELISESSEVYRGEYLAASILFEAEAKGSTGIGTLLNAAKENTLTELVRKAAEPRYQEGYDKGVHDADASLILTELLTLRESVGLLAYAAAERRLAWVYMATKLNDQARQQLVSRCHNLYLMEQTFGSSELRAQLSNELAQALTALTAEQNWLACDSGLAADYLINEFADGKQQYVLREAAQSLVNQLQNQLKHKSLEQQLQSALAGCSSLEQKMKLHLAWLTSFAGHQGVDADQELILEGASLMTLTEQLKFYDSSANTSGTVKGLLGQHGRIKERVLAFNYQEFIARLRNFANEQVPAFTRFHQMKQQILTEQRQRLRLQEFKPGALSSFVRNKLINDVYFPIIGTNLAKQIGAAGNNKRSDLMGLLLMISPPGYGKTTLIEYVASKLGMTFVKVNCPSIGHEQLSLDPAQANNSTARSEVEKINLAFEMGNNVMLYLDDIQHTNPEFLQKFISLCDGSRRVDGVWNGESKTYDMRGKKFAVVMAGNPYTESGEAFTIPDMLANRADIYNLGDTLSGREHEFSLSFIENSLTSNSYIAPLATRDMDDLYQLVKMADGEPLPITELKHGYSQAEVNEIIAVIQRIRKIQQTVLKANEQYIASAAQDDKYRVEPPFKLQGSYRNMNKMAEKVVPVMTDEELELLIADHYRGEAQTLTVGAEENLLKLAELRETLTDEQEQRWQQIKNDYVRHQNLGSGDDPLASIASQISLLQQGLGQIGSALEQPKSDGLDQISQSLSALTSQLNGQKTEAGNNAELEKTLAIFSEKMEAFLTPLVTTLQNNQALDSALVETLKTLEVKPGQPVRSATSEIQKISRELVQDRENSSDELIQD